MKKKVIVYMLLFAMVCSVFAGCDNTIPGEGTQNTQKEQTETEHPGNDGQEGEKDTQEGYVDSISNCQHDRLCHGIGQILVDHTQDEGDREQRCNSDR